VQRVLLARLLQPPDLDNELLVLPLLQSLLVGGADAGGKQAAARALSALVPSAKALVLLRDHLEAIKQDPCHYSDTCISHMRSFVANFRTSTAQAGSKARGSKAAGKESPGWEGAADCGMAGGEPAVAGTMQALVLHQLDLMSSLRGQRGRKRRLQQGTLPPTSVFGHMKAEAEMCRLQQQLSDFQQHQHQRQQQGQQRHEQGERQGRGQGQQGRSGSSLAQGPLLPKHQALPRHLTQQDTQQLTWQQGAPRVDSQAGAAQAQTGRATGKPPRPPAVQHCAPVPTKTGSTGGRQRKKAR